MFENYFLARIPVASGKGIPRQLLLLILVFSLGPQLTAQVSIQGRITDADTGDPLSLVTVVLRDSLDNFLDGTSTDINGAYQMDWTGAGARLQFSFVGYREITTLLPGEFLAPAFTQNIQLEADTEILELVEVRAEKTRTRQLIDRRVIEVGKDLQSAGGDGATVLRSLPEVQLDGEGFLQLRGSGNVTVLINGRPSPLPTNDLLRQLDAANILRVEIITAPSAKQRAEGLSGIINIITGQDTRRGLFGQLNGSGNNFGAFRFGTTLGYGGERLSAWGGLNFNRNNSYSFNEMRREGIAPFDRRTRMTVVGPATTLRTGATWETPRGHKWSGNVQYVDDLHDHEFETTLQEATPRTLESYASHRHQTWNATVNYLHYFDQEEAHQLSLDADWSYNRNDLENENFAVPAEDRYQYTLETVKLLNLAADYQRSLGAGELEAGALLTLRQLTSTFLQSEVTNELVSNSFDYEQPTWAAYFLTRQKLGSWEVQLGLRFEDYRATFETTTGTPVIRQQFANFFPSAHALWRIAEEQSISLGYNRRTARPNHHQINPFRLLPYPTDQRSGNLALRPEFSQNVEVNYQLEANKITLRLGAHLRWLRDDISPINETDTAGILLTRWINLGDPINVGWESNFRYLPTESYELNLSVNGGVGSLLNPSAEAPIDPRRSRYLSIDLRQNFTWWKRLKFDLSWSVSFLEKGFFSNRSGFYELDAALRLPIWNKRGEISVRGRNILASFLIQSERFGQDFTAFYEWTPQAPIFFLSGSYRIGAEKDKP